MIPLVAQAQIDKVALAVLKAHRRAAKKYFMNLDNPDFDSMELEGLSEVVAPDIHAQIAKLTNDDKAQMILDAPYELAEQFPFDGAYPDGTEADSPVERLLNRMVFFAIELRACKLVYSKY